MAETKTCTSCRAENPATLEFFHKDQRAPTGLAPRCKTCNNASTKERNSPERARRRALQARYGMTVEGFQELENAQGGRCAICGETPEGNLHVDHDHSCCPGRISCGECVRGLLCGKCNKALGMFKDDPERLRAAADYLEEYAG